jgi:AcrR family transcriptional regulator
MPIQAKRLGAKRAGRIAPPPPAKPKAGRRPGRNTTRDDILDAAEETFAAGGYAGTSLREIAARAAVNQALLHHYFGTKEGLFQAIFVRRGHALARERLRLLTALEQRPGAPPSVEEIVGAFLTAAYDLKRGGAGGIAFLQLQARLHTEAQWIDRDLRHVVYDEPIQRYLAALRRSLPDVDQATLYWRFIFALGSYLYTISDAHRLETISGRKCDPQNLDESLRQLVGFLTAGLSAPARSGRSAARKTPRPKPR